MANKAQKKVVRLSATRKASLALVAPAAFAAGQSEGALADAIRASGGKQDHVTREALVGRMAYGFAARGDKREPAALFTYAALVIDKPGLNSDQPKRRTKIEHDVWNSAKVWLTGFLKRHGIASTGKNAGNSNAAGKTRKPRPGTTAKDEKSALGLAPKQSAQTFKTIEDLVHFVDLQSAMLLATCNKNAKIASMSSRLLSAVQDFRAAVKPLNDELSTNNRMVKRLKKAQA